MKDRCMITCLKLPPLLRIEELDSETVTVYSMAVAEGNICDSGVDWFTVEEGNITEELVSNVHKNGKKIFAWTVNTAENVQHLIDCGIDGILTDDPIMIRNTINNADYSTGFFKAMRLYSERMINGF